MSSRYAISVVIPTCPHRKPKLEALLEGIAATATDRDAFEVIVVVDDLDDEPLRAAAILPPEIHFKGLTQASSGPSGARNRAIEQAQGDWLLFFNDDARVNADTIPQHIRRIREDPHADVALLGRTHWVETLLDSPWRRLLYGSPMLFFWDQVRADRTYGFRYFWTTNLSVPTSRVRQVGGFNESFPYAMHEDIELGWRLQQRFGLEIHPLLTSDSWHDHALSPREYFHREHRCGQAARVARTASPEFHDAVWGWVGDADQVAEVLNRLFARSGRQVRQLLEAWAVPSDDQPGPNEMHAAYLAHLPLKRMAFCQGYLDRPFESWWDQLESSATWPPSQTRERINA